MKRRFLTAEWRHLLMLNYEIAPAALRPLAPPGTEIDSWNGRTFLSVVGFLFLNTRLLGLPVPFHRNFPEVNLRIYVRRDAADGRRRGVVFVKEIVPKWAVAAVARWVYNENYVAHPMQSHVQLPDAARGVGGRVEYGWTSGGRPNSLAADFAGEPALPAAGSEEEFITEHYWAYVKQRNGSALEYGVEHPPWRVWRASAARLDCDVEGNYGKDFAAALGRPPSSAFVAEGSPVAVFQGEGLAAASGLSR
ncbi:MAG TPA: DUF2071 domain-containing protein [Gemmataceae bacterium]|nr:DUF2071 domain-containing protein [Gemmataceae bacterium]